MGHFARKFGWKEYIPICLYRFDKVDMALLTVQDNPSTNNTFMVCLNKEEKEGEWREVE